MTRAWNERNRTRRETRWVEDFHCWKIFERRLLEVERKRLLGRSFGRSGLARIPVRFSALASRTCRRFGFRYEIPDRRSGAIRDGMRNACRSRFEEAPAEVDATSGGVEVDPERSFWFRSLPRGSRRTNDALGSRRSIGPIEPYGSDDRELESRVGSSGETVSRSIRFPMPHGGNARSLHGDSFRPHVGRSSSPSGRLRIRHFRRRRF